MSDVKSVMWRDILLRLPAESLFRFRAVCKRWRTVIDDPVFVKAHTNNQVSSNSNTILVRNLAGPPFYPLYYFNLEALDFTVDSPQTISVIPLNLTRSGLSRVSALPVAACNGLLLTAPKSREKNWDPKGALEIRNPVTHECLLLPQQDFNSHVEGYGIGYDSANDDYKVVVIDYNCCNGISIRRTHVYSLKSDSWKTIGNCPFGLSKQDNFQRGVFLGGAVHWLSSGDDGVIIAFDVGSETYHQLALPGFETRPGLMQLDALSGCLFLSCVDDNNSWKGRLSMWVMNDYGREYQWKVLLSLEKRDLRPVAYMKNNHCLLLQHYSGFTWFDVVSESYKSIDIHGISRYSAQACVGSLFRLHHSCGGRVAVAPPTRMKNMGYNKLTFCVRRHFPWHNSRHDDCYKSDSDWYDSSCQGGKEIHVPLLDPNTTLPVIPMDICREIFLRLPANSLVRFRGVCKSWRSVIDEPGFVKSHTNKELTIIIRNTSGPPFYPFYSFDLDHLDFTEGLQNIPVTPLDFTPSGLSRLKSFSVAACNGLMLIPREKTFEIWNPTTHECLGLPRGKFNPKGAVFGLGYDEYTDDYKAVVIHGRCRRRERETYVFRTHVYSLRSDSWRMIGNAPNAEQLSGPEGHGVFLHGALHWMFTTSGWRGDYTILSLDLRTEKYRQMELPTFRTAHSVVERKTCLYVLGGCLILNDYCNSFSGYHYEVWVMKDYGDKDSWVKLFSVGEDDDYKVLDCLSPVSYMKDGMRVFLQEECRGFFMYDIEKKSMKKVGIHGLSLNSYAQLIPGSIFRLHDNCGVNGRRRRRRKRIIRKREGQMKLCDTELSFCAKDAKCYGYEDHDNCFCLDLNGDCSSSEEKL